jgi:hypothetical protein
MDSPQAEALWGAAVAIAERARAWTPEGEVLSYLCLTHECAKYAAGGSLRQELGQIT